MRRVALPWTTAYSLGTEAVFIPTTPYLPSGEIDKFRQTFELHARTAATFQAQAAYQEADVESSPATAQGFGANQTTEAICYPTAWETASFTKQLVRFGYMVKLSTGTTLTLARLGGVVEIKSCG